MLFTSLIESARQSPFKGPISRADCESSPVGNQLVAGRNIAAASAATGDSCEFGSTKYFLLCGLGGIISCGKYIHCRIGLNECSIMLTDGSRSVHSTRFHTHIVDATRFSEMSSASRPG